MNASLVPSIFLTVSALLEIEPSVQEEFQVNTTWENWADENGGHQTDFVIPIYVVLCSLSANPTHGVVDMQNNSLLSPVAIWQPSTQWEKYQWMKNDTWEAEISRALSSPAGSGYTFSEVNGTDVVEPSMTDEYIINGGPNATFIMRLDKLELVVANTTGQLGTSNEGLQPGNGMAYVNEELIALRLNLSFAAFASVIMLGLTLYMTRASDALHDRAAIPSIGALQLLWLGHHSASITEAMETVKEPTEASLREAGMIDRLAGEVDHGLSGQLGVGVGDVSIYYK
ncbi:hypothetical protein DFH29DRAFT_924755 [Suillus ampliporus]|nr:hypothetical protein DFH29DRAFT_924755 [Suillus ampliporus]